MTAATVSEKRHRIVLEGGRFGAVVRTPNYQEFVQFLARWEKDSHAASIVLCDAILVEDLKPKKPLTPAAKASIGTQVAAYAGDGAAASEIEPGDCSDEIAAVAKEYEGKRDIVCLRLEDKHFETRDFVFLEPDAGQFESYSTAKRKGGSIDTDRDFVKRHLVKELQPQIAELEREAPLAFAVLAKELAKVGGVTFEGTLGKA